VTLSIRLAAFMSVAFAVAPAAHAQGPAGTDEKAVTVAPITGSGAPRSYQVLSIPVPGALAKSPSVQLELVPHGDFVILGARARSIAVTAKSTVAVTIGIPANALAGRVIAADARFSAAGTPIIIVPIEMDISLIRKIALRASAASINGQAGNDVIVPFEITNAGNSRENLKSELGLPAGWASRDVSGSSITIEPGETIKKRVRLTIPSLSSTGSSFVRIVLRSGDEILGDETMAIGVFNSSSVGQQAGPVITTAFAHAADETGRPNNLMTLSATGALFDSVRMDARVSHGSALGGAASNAFSHLGSYQSAASLSLTAPSGQLNVGNTGTSFSDLTGLYPYGEGALLKLQHPSWSFTGLGAVSVAQTGTTARKPMIGFRGEKQVGQVQLSTSVSHLADAGASPRRLDAIGAGAAIPTIFGSTFKAEIAERRFDGGSGFGWSSGLVRTGSESSEEFRVTHAPGGSDAFARATNELIANLSERLTSRVSLSATGWRTSDATSVFSGLDANGVSVRPQYAIHGSTTLALEARTYAFDAVSRPSSTNAGGGFGNRDQQLGVSLSSYLRQYYFSTSAYLGNETRTVSPAGQSVITDRTPRNYWTTNAGWSGAGGTIDAHSRIEQTRDRGGFVNQQTTVGVRADQVVIPRVGGLRAEGELDRVYGFGDETSSIVRAGIAVPIVNGLAFKIDAERNSIFHSLSGRVPWIIGLRVEHSLTMPMLRQPGTSGYIYQDLNSNQRRDPGEDGIAGVIVRRGSETAVADASGKYRLAGDPRKPIVIDEASLPDGLTPSGAARGDLGVTLTTAAEIELVVAPRSGIAEVHVDLDKARVIARDSAGREWIARMTGPTTATFESLPVGSYTLDFDLSDLSEPLVPRGPVPMLVVTGKDSRSIAITLDPRPIRMWKASGPKQ
jgi:hypothetical protein